MPGGLDTPQNCWAMVRVGSGPLQKWCVLWRAKEKTKFLQQFINSLSDFFQPFICIGVPCEQSLVAMYLSAPPREICRESTHRETYCS